MPVNSPSSSTLPTTQPPQRKSFQQVPKGLPFLWDRTKVKPENSAKKLSQPVHPDERELLVSVKAPGKAVKDAALEESLGPGAVLPKDPCQAFQAIVPVLALKI